MAAASTGALLIDGERLRKADGPSSPEYREIRDRLRAIRDANHLGSDRVFVLREDKEGRFVFAVTPHEDRDAFAGALYPASIPEVTRGRMRLAMSGNVATVTPPFTDEHGTWIAAFAPVRVARGDKAGDKPEVVGLLEADVSLGELEGARLRAARDVVIDSLVAAVVAVLFGAYFARRLVRPIRVLTDRMELIAAGSADLTQEIDLGSGHGDVRDEMRGLVSGFNRAVRSLRELVTAVHRIGRRAAQSAASGEQVGKALLDGSQAQAKALDKTRAAAQALDSSAQRITLATEELDASAHDIASAIVGLDQSVTDASSSLQRMNSSVHSTASNIGQLGNAIQTINRNVDSLSETALEVTSWVTDLDASLRDINRFTEETAVFSVTTREAAEAGRAAVSATAEGMTEIESHTRRVSETMTGLATVSDEIGEIVQVIRSVAERTNLLALNAAIIAARAGEQGLGFQVVAQEIRDLAERTRMSTADIAGLIARVQRGAADAVQMVQRQSHSVTRGRELAVEALGELDRIGGVADETSTRIEGIVRRAEEQTSSSRRLLSGVERIKEMLQLITRATREQTSSAAALERAAEQMQVDSDHTTGAFDAQANQIRGIVETMEHMAERIGQIAAQTRGQQGEVQRVGQGIRDVLVLADGFQSEAHRLEAAMSAISSDIVTLTAQVEHYKIT